MSLKSTASVIIHDVLCEGEIEGFANTTPEESVFLNKTALTGSYELDYKLGTQSQTTIAALPNTSNPVTVNTALTYNNPITRSVTNQDIDDLDIIIRIDSLYDVSANGNYQNEYFEVDIEISTTAEGVIQTRTARFTGQTKKPYQRLYKIVSLGTMGTAPFSIKLTRTTDVETIHERAVISVSWDSYNELINDKFTHPYSAHTVLKLNAKDYNNIPARQYKIQGLKVYSPINYDPETRIYTGTWNGNMYASKRYTNNPAWIIWDLLTDPIHGLGYDESYIDKWALYTISQYNDVDVNYSRKNADGSTTAGTEPRFTFNGVLNTRKDAHQILNIVCSSCNVQYAWSGNILTFFQDSPVDYSSILTNANVLDGNFSYASNAYLNLITQVDVKWMDSDNFGQAAVETVIADHDDIQKYGLKKLTITGYGCTSRSQAARLGKWKLYSELQQGETVTFGVGFDQLDLSIGDVVDIYDEFYSGSTVSGKVVSSTTTSLIVDRSIENIGTATITMRQPDGTLVERVLTDATGTTLAWTTAVDPAPQSGSIFGIRSSSLAPRKFKVTSIQNNSLGNYDIGCVFYDADKWTEIETGVQYQETPYSNLQDGEITAPTDISATAYSYVDGETGGSSFGVDVEWTHTTDDRLVTYDVQNRGDVGEWVTLGQTTSNSYQWLNSVSGTFDFRVRTIADNSLTSDWLTVNNIVTNGSPSACEAPTALICLDSGSTTFDGRDCEVSWTHIDLTDVDNRHFKDYQIEVMTTADVNLRYIYTTENNFVYTYQMNEEDNSGTAIRNPKFKVWSRDVYDTLNTTPATLLATNPQPSMTGLTPTVTALVNGLSVSWSAINPTDNDIIYYEVLCDTNATPTHIFQRAGSTEIISYYYGLSPDSTYYARVRPVDAFGNGTYSNVASTTPLVIPAINITEELTQNQHWTDMESHTEAALSVLYDGTKDSGGIAYAAGAWRWIQIQYALDYLIDRVLFWTSATVQCYIGYSNDNVTWNYLKAETDHTLTDNTWVAATSQSDAEANYFSATGSGQHYGFFPNMTTARYVRLYINGAHTMYELKFCREVVAEQIVCETLSAISVDCGTLTAGALQSTNYSATAGMQIDLDNETIICGGSTTPELEYDGTDLTLRGALVAGEIKSPDYSTTEGFHIDLENEYITIGGSGANCKLRFDGTDLTIYGDTIIHGDSVVTGTLSGSKIITGTLQANRIVTNSITADRVYSNAGINDQQLNYAYQSDMGQLGSIGSGYVTHNTGRYAASNVWLTNSTTSNDLYDEVNWLFVSHIANNTTNFEWSMQVNHYLSCCCV